MRTRGLVSATVVLATIAACGDSGVAERRLADRATASEPGGGQTVTAPAPPVIDPDDGGAYRPDVAGADFVARIDNPYLPLEPGARWVYQGESGGGVERVEVQVLDERREVFGTSAVVVQDRVFLDGELVEDTRDWFAQDRGGNVWYLGEETAEYEDGEVISTEGSWEAGVDGALPGIVMLADPQPGRAYRQEFDPGEAEDLAEVLRTDDRGSVPAGEFAEVVAIREWTPLEPDVVEEKHYAPGIGLISEHQVTGDGTRLELIEYSEGS